MEEAERKKYYKAMLARDPRYDGRFYTGVKTTGIYCRPICPAKPLLKNIIFYRSKAEAENAGYRPCLRCRPDLSPLSPQWQGTAGIMPRALRLLEQGDSEGQDLTVIAEKLGMTDRHLRRLFQEHIGASPIEVAISRRLHLARQLLSQTSLSITEVAFAAGFNSTRRFNDAFAKVYQTPPRNFRKALPAASEDSLVIELPVIKPFDWNHLLHFFGRHAIAGVEVVDTQSYARHFATESGHGYFRASLKPGGEALRVELQLTDLADLRWVIERIRTLFDLAHNPHTPSLRKSKHFDPNSVRIPGSFDTFEGAVGVVLGQLVTTEQAKRNLQKLVERFGKKTTSKFNPALTHYFPTPKVLANAKPSDWEGLGFTKTRCLAIQEIARGVSKGELDLSPSCDLLETRQKLLAINGVGPWTVEMVAMRCLKDPDAFPGKDLIVMRAIEKFKFDSTRYAPWRAYLAVAIWKTQAHLLTRKKKV